MDNPKAGVLAVEIAHQSEPEECDGTGTRISRHTVRERLRELIITGHYPPGSRLVQNELARQLNTSVTLVREVLSELMGVGLVEAQRNLGFFVGSLDAKKLTEAHRVRAALDGLAARMCCERAGREDIRQLRELVEEDRAQRASGDYEQIRQWLLPSRNLHLRILRIADCPALGRAMGSFWVPVVTTERPWEGRVEDDYREHAEIVEAIETNRPDEAERAAREHVHHVLQYVSGLLDSKKAKLSWWYV
jgi:DNA-binding GntR family transcriptional regulator